MNSGDLELNAFFTTNGKDLWFLGEFCSQPTCKLTNVATGAVESFGMGGLTANRFHKIEPPDIAKDTIKDLATIILSLRRRLEPFIKDSPGG